MSRIQTLLLLWLWSFCCGLSFAADPGSAAQPPAAAQQAIPQTNAEIRQWYNDQVAQIPALDQAWQKQGLSPEQRARKAFEIRHQARIQAREYMQDKA